jgi:SAM-dependent methyltransferase
MAVHEAARRGFERQSDAYERGRPAYPPQAIDWLARQLNLEPGRTVIDVGAGTGKLTRPLRALGAEVIAIEPVAGMRAVLERELAGLRALDGTAESVPLPSTCADAVVVGQAFHWFDAPRALTEFHRVLRPGGRLALVWNMRDRSQPLQQAIDKITEPLRGDTPSQVRGAWRSAFADSRQFVLRDELSLPFELEVARDTFVDRIMSISFIAARDDPERHEVQSRVEALASEHPEPWAYVCEAYVFDRIGETDG